MERFQAFGQQSSQVQMEIEKISDQTDGSSSSTSDVTTALGLSKQTNVYRPMAPPPISTTLGLPSGMEEAEGILFLNQSNKQGSTSNLLPNCTTLFPVSAGSNVSPNAVDDLHRLVSYQQATMNQHQYYITDYHHQQQQQQSELISTLQPPQSQSQAVVAQQLSLNVQPGSLPTAFSDRLWEWNPIPEANREYNNINPFK